VHAYPVSPHPAIFFGKRNAHETKVRHLPDDIVRVFSAGRDLLGPWRYLFLGKSPDLLANHLLLFGKIEIHVSSPSTVYY
jgi:hypothetical protein